MPVETSLATGVEVTIPSQRQIRQYPIPHHAPRTSQPPRPSLCACGQDPSVFESGDTYARPGNIVSSCSRARVDQPPSLNLWRPRKSHFAPPPLNPRDEVLGWDGPVPTRRPDPAPTNTRFSTGWPRRRTADAAPLVHGCVWGASGPTCCPYIVDQPTRIQIHAGLGYLPTT